MKQENSQFATKKDVEELAVMTAKEFVEVHRKIDALDSKVTTGFTETLQEFRDVRREMQDGFRAVLAAVESVEYTKLRMRIDALETDVTKLKERIS